MVLKKEVVKTQNKDLERGGEYRQMLVQVRCRGALTAHTCGLCWAGACAAGSHTFATGLGRVGALTAERDLLLAAL